MIRNRYVKKTLVFLIIGLVVGLAFISCASKFDEVIDQHQDDFYSGQGFTVNVDEYGKAHVVAQSFIPAITPLTKVDLAIVAAMYGSLPVIVSIRSELGGNDLTAVGLSPEQVPQDNISWCSFDFPDITVVPETTYYIVVRTNQTFVGYCIGYNHSNQYPRGNTWLCYDGNWTDYSSDDLAFRTYSINTPPPCPPNISGPHYGKTNTTYEFSIGITTDPDGDSFYVQWDWGDGNLGDWLGPYNSGAFANASHAWDTPGNYTIKTKIKDVYGAVSNWSNPFLITIVQLKMVFFIGTFTSLNQTGDLLILGSKFFITFPSNQIINIGNKIVISKDAFMGLGPAFIFGLGELSAL